MSLRPSGSPGALLACLLGGCTLFEPVDPDLHQWGSYQLCLQRVADDCVGEDGCASPAVDTSRLVSLSTRPSDGTFLLSRHELEPALGRQSGDRFELKLGPVRAPYCGCEMEVREVIRGTLERKPREPGCGALAGVTCGEPDEGEPIDDPPGDDWLEGDPAAFDPLAQYLGLEGTVITEVTPAPGASGCSCGPCRVTWRLTGWR